MSFEFFLTCLVSHARPCLHRPWWREHLTSDELATLERLGWLRNEGRADWYPCGGNCPERSERRVLPEPLKGDRWQTECPAFECLDEVVAGTNLEQLSAQGTALALWLRERLRGSGPLPTFERSGLHGLGRVEWREQTREGVLVTGVTPPELPLVLRELQDITERWFVFVPEQRRLSMKLRSQHGPRAAVQVVGLDEWLEFTAGRPVLRLPELEVREPAAPAYAAEPIVAEVFEATGKRGLSASACALLIEQQATFDLFLDLTRVVEGSRHPASRRAPSGEVTVSSLSRHESEAAAELIRRREQLGGGDFKTISVRAIHKLIEGVREALDVKLGRFDWRAFHTIRGETAEKKRWLFRPPAELKFAVLIPVRGGADPIRG